MESNNARVQSLEMSCLEVFSAQLSRKRHLMNSMVSPNHLRIETPITLPHSQEAEPKIYYAYLTIIRHTGRGHHTAIRPPARMSIIRARERRVRISLVRALF